MEEGDFHQPLPVLGIHRATDCKTDKDVSNVA